MKLCNTTGAFDFYRLPQLDRVKILEDVGFRNIDVSFFREGTPQSVFMQDNWTEYADSMKNYADSHGMKYVQAHCPNGNPIIKDANYDMLLASTIRCIEVCGRLGIKNAVFHAGWEAEISKQEFHERNIEFLNKLIPTLEETGVTLCYENLQPRKHINRFLFYDAKDLLDFFELVNHPLVQACWDTGHANIVGFESQYEEIVKLGDHLRAVHIQDNRGNADDHLLPYMGTINYDAVMNGLKDINYSGYFTFEGSSVVRFDNNVLYPRRKFEKDTRALNPTVDIQIAMLRLSYEIGKRILTAYDCYEE